VCSLGVIELSQDHDFIGYLGVCRARMKDLATRQQLE